jgi:glycosyltransferase involved in cell wall biosynthesis
MRIAYLTNSSDRSGVGYRALEIKKHIRASKKDVRIYDFHLDGRRGLLSKEGRPIDWVSTRFGLKNKSINWIRLGSRWKKYIRQRDKRQYDVWHVTNQSLSWLTRSAVQPTVVTVHDLIELTDPQHKLAKYVNRYLLSGIKDATQIIAVSKYTAGEVEKYYGISGDKITVIYNGVGNEWQHIEHYRDTIGYQAAKKKWGIGNDTKIILFVGSDHPRKNAGAAIHVLGELIKQGQNVILLKAGAAGILAEREKLLAKIDQAGLRSRVKFIGDVSNEELNELYNMCDVLLFPSTNEGFGLPLVQAMATQLPIVTVKATAIPEVVGNASIMCQAGDEKAMVQGVQDVLVNERLRGRLKALGKKQVEHFSWEKSARQVIDVYKKVLWAKD